MFAILRSSNPLLAKCHNLETNKKYLFQKYCGIYGKMAQYTWECIIGSLYQALGEDVIDPLWDEFAPLDENRDADLGTALLERAIECGR